MNQDISTTLQEVFSDSFTGFVETFINFIPNFVIAVLIVLIGWFIGGLIGKAIVQLVRITKLRNVLKNFGVDHAVQRLGVSFKPGYFLGKVGQWIIMIIALMAAFDLIGLSQVNDFLERIMGYIPRILVVVVILGIAAFVGEVLRKIVVRSAQAARVEFAGVFGSVIKWSVLILAILASLFELGIAATFIQTLFTGLIVALALALGLSFGIGGSSHAQEFIGSVRKQFKKDNDPDHYHHVSQKEEKQEVVEEQFSEEELKRDLQGNIRR